MFTVDVVLPHLSRTLAESDFECLYLLVCIYSDVALPLILWKIEIRESAFDVLVGCSPGKSNQNGRI